MEIANALEVTTQTLVGKMGKDFPRKSGNCFSVETDQGKEYRIVNFNVENWEEMIKRGLELPIKIGILGGRTAIIHDDRIPEEWYDYQYCPTCCPEFYLPEPQKLAKERKRSRGHIKPAGDWEIEMIDPRHEAFPLFYQKPDPIPVDGYASYIPIDVKCYWEYKMQTNSEE